jgi:hypothetical protein
VGDSEAEGEARGQSKGRQKEETGLNGWHQSNGAVKSDGILLYLKNLGPSSPSFGPRSRMEKERSTRNLAEKISYGGEREEVQEEVKRNELGFCTQKWKQAENGTAKSVRFLQGGKKPSGK